MRIKDVAKEAGVSTATVSHVINNTRRVSDATRERVLRAVERCNYYPNAQARTLASGRSNMLGLLVSDISNPFFPEIVKSVQEAASQRGYDVILADTSYDARRTSSCVRRMIERQVAGVALMTSELDPNLVDNLGRREVSVVFLDLGSAGGRMSTLMVDYEMGIEQAIRHLVELNHERIAYIGGPAGLFSAERRLQAFQRSFALHLPSAGIPPVYEGDFHVDGAKRAAARMLSQPEYPSAVVVANDLMALGVMRECRRAGLAIPRDISIVGFDDIAFAALADPPLTTVRLSREELGSSAVELLLKTIENPEQTGLEVRISTNLVIRGSTSSARPRGHDVGRQLAGL
ncbi:MAG TPA: LacI family DNA-binding transcriptional regulator [Blastocatellia bacterium]|nr:LacI family DNA-binding transcriptional regulator [Blastocatellia bacterium]